MNNKDSTQNIDATLRAASGVASLLPQFAGIAMALSGLAYYVGWRESSAYYAELGAPWAASIVPSIRLIQQSAGLIGTMAILAMLSVVWISRKEVSAVGLRRWSIALLVISALLFVPSLFLTGWVTPTASYIYSVLAALCLVVSAGLTIGELIALLAENNQKWNHYHLMLIFFIILFGIYQAPDHLGRARAQLDGDLLNSKLPIVQTATQEITNSERLVFVTEGAALLVELAGKREDRTFRIVAASEIKRIRTPRTK